MEISHVASSHFEPQIRQTETHWSSHRSLLIPHVLPTVHQICPLAPFQESSPSIKNQRVPPIPGPCSMICHYNGHPTTYPWRLQTRALRIPVSHSSNCGKTIPTAVAGRPCLQSQLKQVSFCTRRRENVHSDSSRYAGAPSLPSLPPLYRPYRLFISLPQEFYTPQAARSISFVNQAAVDDGHNARHLAVLDIAKRSDASGRSKSLTVGPSFGPRLRRVSSPGDGTYGSQLSLFVVFEKKAGLIRIADSAVDEIEMYDDGMQPPVLPVSEKSPSLRRSLQAFDAFGFGNNHKGAWLPLCSLEVPTGAFAEDRTPLTRPIVLISRGRQTHIHPSPLPVPLAWSAPLRSIWWNQPPNNVTARVCSSVGKPPFLQVIAYGDGVEVVELDFSFLTSRAGLSGKGKGRAAPVEPNVKAYTPAFDHSRFACRGGEWHLLDTTHGRPEVRRSMQNVDGLGTRELVERVKMEEGFYGCYMKDVEDYRVFWMGNLRPEQDGMPDISRLSMRGQYD